MVPQSEHNGAPFEEEWIIIVMNYLAGAVTLVVERPDELFQCFILNSYRFCFKMQTDFLQYELS